MGWSQGRALQRSKTLCAAGNISVQREMLVREERGDNRRIRVLEKVRGNGMQSTSGKRGL